MGKLGKNITATSQLVVGKTYTRSDIRFVGVFRGVHRYWGLMFEKTLGNETISVNIGGKKHTTFFTIEESYKIKGDYYWYELIKD